MRMRLVTAAVTCLAIVAGGCGGSGSDTSDVQTTGSTTVDSTTTTTAATTSKDVSTDSIETDAGTDSVDELADEIAACLNDRGVGEAGRGPSQPTSERVLLTPGAPGEGAVIVELDRRAQTATVIHFGVKRKLLDQVMSCVPPDQVKRRLTFDLFTDDPDSQPVEYKP